MNKVTSGTIPLRFGREGLVEVGASAWSEEKIALTVDTNGMQPLILALTPEMFDLLRLVVNNPDTLVLVDSKRK